ncbi:hypothetical protein BJ742DRAFT_797417 [Cladochytrium replicatum]|nr:hypothetical protein BJ742DRAFT_797417 [Cladochytrium replicatum]
MVAGLQEAVALVDKLAQKDADHDYNYERLILQVAEQNGDDSPADISVHCARTLSRFDGLQKQFITTSTLERFLGSIEEFPPKLVTKEQVAEMEQNARDIQEKVEKESRTIEEYSSKLKALSVKIMKDREVLRDNLERARASMANVQQLREKKRAIEALQNTQKEERLKQLRQRQEDARLKRESLESTYVTLNQSLDTDQTTLAELEVGLDELRKKHLKLEEKAKEADLKHKMMDPNNAEYLRWLSAMVRYLQKILQVESVRRTEPNAIEVVYRAQDGREPPKLTVRVHPYARSALASTDIGYRIEAKVSMPNVGPQTTYLFRKLAGADCSIDDIVAEANRNLSSSQSLIPSVCQKVRLRVIQSYSS